MTRLSPAQSPMPCSVTKYEMMTHSCPCEQFVSAMTRSARTGVTMWYRWARAKFQKGKDRVFVEIISFGLSENANKGIKELKLVCPIFSLYA